MSGFEERDEARPAEDQARWRHITPPGAEDRRKALAAFSYAIETANYAAVTGKYDWAWEWLSTAVDALQRLEGV